VEMGKAQALLFSATTPTWINQMVKQFLKDPLRLDAASDGEARTATTVKQLPLSANPSPSLSLALSQRCRHNTQPFLSRRVVDGMSTFRKKTLRAGLVSGTNHADSFTRWTDPHTPRAHISHAIKSSRFIRKEPSRMPRSATVC
jgi:superfamily II DNA/RNA helicase